MFGLYPVSESPICRLGEAPLDVVAAKTGNPPGFGYVSVGVGMNFGGTRPVKRTLWGLVAVVGLVSAACGQTSLDTAGDRSTGWIDRKSVV